MAGPGAELDRIEEPDPLSSSRRREPSARRTLGVSQPTNEYVGIDLHRRRRVVVRISADGSVLETVRIEKDPLALAAELAKAGPRRWRWRRPWAGTRPPM